MHVSIPTPPPPPSPQDVVNAANDAINDLTGGGGQGGGPSSGSGGGNPSTGIIGVCMVPAPPGPPIPVPYPNLFTDETARHAAEQGGTSSGDGTTIGAEPKLPGLGGQGGALQEVAHPLALAVQAIAIVLGDPGAAGTGLPAAVVTFVAIALGGPAPKSPASEVSVRNAIDAILKRFAVVTRHPSKHEKINAVREKLHVATSQGLVLAARLFVSHPTHCEALARRHLIALLKARTHG